MAVSDSGPNRSVSDLNRFLHPASVAELRQAWQLSKEANSRTDSILTWVVGLSAGAIALLLQGAERLGNRIGWPILLFGLSVLFGLLCRHLLASLALRNDKLTAKRLFYLITLPSRQDESRLSFPEEMMSLVPEGTREDGSPQDRFQNDQVGLDRLVGIVTTMSWLPTGLLVVGATISLASFMMLAPTSLLGEDTSSTPALMDQPSEMTPELSTPAQESDESPEECMQTETETGEREE